MNTSMGILVGAVIVIAILGGLFWYLNTAPEISVVPTPTPATSTTPTPSPGGEASTTPTASVRLAFLDTSGNTNGKSRGCDKVVMTPWRIATTTAPLTGALRALFNINTTTVSGAFNFIDRTNETLKFDRATVANGTANIYLTGSLSGLAGVCDDPRASIQIEETALQFPTVQRVQLYLNNQPTTLIPSQK